MLSAAVVAAPIMLRHTQQPVHARRCCIYYPPPHALPCALLAPPFIPHTPSNPPHIDPGSLPGTQLRTRVCEQPQRSFRRCWVCMHGNRNRTSAGGRTLERALGVAGALC